MIENLKEAWRKWKGDGCTDVPDWNNKVHTCCMRHDKDYAFGVNEKGEPITRAQADERLFQCMNKHAKTIIGRQILSRVYWLGVRAVGWKFWKHEVDK